METKDMELGTLFVMVSNKFETNFLQKEKMPYEGWVCILIEKATKHCSLSTLYCFNDRSKRYIHHSHLYENGGIFKKIDIKENNKQ